MKTLAFLSLVFCASLVWGQSAVGGGALSAEPQVPQFYSHPQHASQRGMAMEQRVLESSTAIVEHGVMPLWEVASLAPAVPLGDIARALRQEHEATRKAERTWTN